MADDWAALAKEPAGGTAGGWSPRHLRRHPRSTGRVSPRRLRARPWLSHDDRHPAQPVEPSRPLGAHLRHPRGTGGTARRAEHRQHRPARPPLGTGRKSGAKIQAIHFQIGGRSRGGPTTKIHALTDGCGRPVAFTLSPANNADLPEAQALPDKCPAPGRLLADKGQDANSLRDRLAATETKAVIIIRWT
jgi:Transposase DDE domain